jgi:hypothetical protein
MPRSRTSVKTVVLLGRVVVTALVAGYNLPPTRLGRLCMKCSCEPIR